jgi:serine/threonine protein kinase/WD40 repeat protein
MITDPHPLELELIQFAQGALPDLEFERLAAHLEHCAQCADVLRRQPLALKPRDAITAQTLITELTGSVIGPYKLLQQIGEGGFGVVYMAEQEKPVRRTVALKVIKPGMDTAQVIARFESERQALAIMDHPNIAKVHDAGATESGRPYFVMELVKGVPITEFCDKNHAPLEARLKLFIDVCHAIQHAHHKGIIHRDIKPSNVMVTLHNGGVPMVKVIDFGVAKATAQKLTERTLFTAYGQMIGSPAYMSPEQAEMSGLDIDTRSDIYSLGVLLYELLTGDTPFDAKELMRSGLDEMRKIIRECEPLTPSSRLSKDTKAKSINSEHSALRAPHSAFDRDLDWIVMKCLEKDRSRRYETANGLAADLERHLNDEPIVACPPSAAYKFRKAFRRNKVMFVAGAAVLVSLVFGLGAATVMFFRERTARNDEQHQRIAAESAQKTAEAERQRAGTQAQKASENEQHSRRLLYASNMNLAQQSLKLNNLGRARRLLDLHRPQPGEEDLRGWEWRYLWQLSRSTALVTLTNRPTRGSSVSFSPDGTRLAVGWEDGRIDLWDVPGRRWVQTLTDRENLRPGRVAFSPLRNLLAATSEPGVVALYDIDSGRESILWRAPDQGASEVRDLAFSQDGSRLVIYAGSPNPSNVGSTPEPGDEVWVVNVSSSQIESHQLTVHSPYLHLGAARLSPDNQRLYLARSEPLNYRYRIQCLDVTTDKVLWQTDWQRDFGLTALALSPDGRVLASGSGYEDPTIHVWEGATGRPITRLYGHTAWVSELAFTRDERLISAATDQTLRFWDTSNWEETKVLRGHTDEVMAVAISEPAHLLASASKDGDIMLWDKDGKGAMNGYRRLPEELGINEVLLLDNSRVLLLPKGKPPELVDLKHDSAPVSLPDIGASTNVLGWFGANILCHWNGTNQIIVRELRGAEFIQRGAMALNSSTRPSGFAYNATRQLLAWTEGSSSTSVCMASLAAPGRRMELKSDVPGLVPFRFSEDGNYLAAITLERVIATFNHFNEGNYLTAVTAGGDSLRAWNVETGQIVARVGGVVRDATFAAGGRVMVVAIEKSNGHEIEFYDLAHPDRATRRFPERYFSWSLAVSPDGGLVASSSGGGQVRLFDPARGGWIDDLHRHLNAVFGIAFSPDGRRLISGGGGRETVKLWDVGTRQELLTLSGAGSFMDVVRWSADGDVILGGAPWQAWRAPTLEEIATREAAQTTTAVSPGD